MRQLLKRIWIAFLAPLFVIMISFPNVTQPHEAGRSDDLSVPPPSLVQHEGLMTITGKGGNGNKETPGEWYIGSPPPNLRKDAPVLLFVQGLNNTAQIWWEDNDMYETAYHAGYQTAFLQLHDAGGASADMWQNGQLLAEKIKEIHSYFGGKPLSVISYSKGGVDTQTALVYFGASRDVDNVITLSSPHHGSELADLAYSFWAGWLAKLLGQLGDGTYVMQTGYMAHFREMTDERPEMKHNDYYTLGGTDWGSFLSATWFGGLYLSGFGPNDGVVTVESSHLPGGTTLAIGDWNHTSIRTGTTFPLFQDYVKRSPQKAEGHSSVHDALRDASLTLPTLNQWVHGGELNSGKEATVSLLIEENVSGAILNVLTTDRLSDIRLLNPQGKPADVTSDVTEEKSGPFQRAIRHTIKLDQPEAGEWILHLLPSQDDAYLLVTDFKTGDKWELKRHDVSLQSQQLSYGLNADPSALNTSSITATYRIVDTKNPAHTQVRTAKGRSALAQHFTLKDPDRVYNVTIDLEGTTQAGNPFRRTMIDTLYTKP